MLQELQKTDSESLELRQYPKNYEEIDRVFDYQGLLFVTETIGIKIICC